MSSSSDAVGLHPSKTIKNKTITWGASYGWQATRSLSRRSAKGGQADSLSQLTTEDSRTMKNELGLLWIPVGFLLMIGAVAALFLTVMPS